MQIFGLEPIFASIIIALIGVGWSIGLGYAKSEGGFNGKKLVTSLLIGIPGAVILVATGIQSAGEVDGLTMLILGVGWILQISGTDSTVKSVASIINKKK